MWLVSAYIDVRVEQSQKCQTSAVLMATEQAATKAQLGDESNCGKDRSKDSMNDPKYQALIQFPRCTGKAMINNSDTNSTINNQN